MGGEKKPLVMSDIGCADGCGRQMGAENCADGCGRRGCNGVAGNWVGRRERKGKDGKGMDRKGKEGTGMERTAAGKWVRRTVWTAADGVGATEWLEMGGEKKPLVMSDLGCADGCGRQMGAENCADGCGRRGCKGVAGNGCGEKKPLVMSDLGCADGCGRRLRTANGCGELRGRLRTAWVQRTGWKWVGRRSRW